jgi:Protein of unknown function (DUF3313)
MTSLRALPLLILACAVSASAQTKDHAPTGLPSASRLTQDEAGSESWTYTKPNMNLRKYRSIMIDPTVVYNGPDAQFDDIKPEDRQRFAGILTEQLRSELGKSFSVVATPRADTMRLLLTLLGAKGTKGGVATATRVTPLGFAATAVRSIAGKQGRFTGSMLLAVELSNGASGQLETAAVRRLAPDALDIPATLSTKDTVKAVAQDLAERLRKRLERETGRG